jgi:hypothetical protein
MTNFCTKCGKEVWDKHAGERCRLVIVLKPDNFSDWYCIPCYREVAKVGQHLSIGTCDHWSGRGQSGVEKQILEVEVTEVTRNYVGWRTVKRDYLFNPKPGTQGEEGKIITKGGFSLRP